MILEVLDDQTGFLYLNAKESITTQFKYKILSTEILNGITVHSIIITQNINKEQKLSNTQIYKCVHGGILDYSSCNTLPSENWQELIEFWSCHNNEFESIKQLQIKVRPKGILLSSFFLLINDTDLPYCCSNNKKEIRKIWVNELQNINHKLLVYEYLEKSFTSDDIFNFVHQGVIYELKLFYKIKCLETKDGIFYNCIKVGLKESVNTNIKVSDEYINEFYTKFIYESILKLNINILGYTTGYIYY